MISFKQYLEEDKYDNLPYAIFTMYHSSEPEFIWIRQKDDLYDIVYTKCVDKWKKRKLDNPYDSRRWINYTTLTDPKKYKYNPLQMSKDKFEEFALTELL